VADAGEVTVSEEVGQLFQVGAVAAFRVRGDVLLISEMEQEGGQMLPDVDTVA
jgi:hypothetical protein